MSRFLTFEQFKKIAVCGAFNKFDPYAEAQTVHFGNRMVTMTIGAEDTYDSFMYRAYGHFKAKYYKNRKERVQRKTHQGDFERLCPYPEDSKLALIWEKCAIDY